MKLAPQRSMTLQEYMEAKGLTASDVAEAIGVKRRAVYRYMHFHRVPRPEVIAKITMFTGGKVTANGLIRPAALTKQSLLAS